MNIGNIRFFTVYNKKNSKIEHISDFCLFIKKVLAASSKNIIEKYREELEKVVPELKNHNNLDVEAIYKDKEKIISRLSNFVHETLRNMKIIFILDNINCISQFFEDFILYNLEKYRYMSRDSYDFYFIFSYSDEEIICNEHLKNLIYYIDKCDKKSGNLKLEGLKEQEVMILLNRIFGIRSEVENLQFIIKINKIVKNCFGNPLFIEEIIKDLFLKEYIYIDNRGFWSARDKILSYELPYSIKEVTLNQLGTIDSKSLYILKYLSLFPKRGVSHKEIKNSNRDYNVEEILEPLVNKGVLVYFYQGKDFIYDFSNRLLKKLVYDSMDEDEKYLMHKKVVSYFEEFSLINFYEDEEFIFHLEKTKDYHKVINYSIIFANKLKKQGDIKKEIYYIDKVVNLLETIGGNLNKQYILTLRLGKLYYRINYMDKALLNYKKALNMATGLKDLKKKIDSLNAILNIYFEYVDGEKSSLVIKEINEILNHIDYKKGKLDMLVIEANLYLLQGDQIKAKNVCENGLKICEEYKSYHKGKIYNILGNLKLNNANYLKGEEFYKLAYDNLKEFSDIEGMARVLNNLGICNMYLTGSNRDPKKYFIEAKRIYEEKGYISETILPSHNLAELYSKTNKYEESISISKNALAICDKHRINIGYLILCNQLLRNNFITGRYSEAFFYYFKAKKYIGDNNVNKFDILDFYYSSAMLYYEIKDYEKSIDYIDKYLQVCREISYEGYDDLIILKHMIYFEKSYVENDIKDDNKFIKLVEMVKVFENEVVKDEFFIKLLFIVRSDKERLGFLWREILNTNNINSLSERFSSEKYYVLANLEEENKLNYLEKALKNCDKNVNPMLSIIIYGTLGEYYLKHEDIYNAINNYIYALKILRKLIKEVPEDLKLQFIKYNNLWVFIEEIFKVERLFLNNNNLGMNLEDITLKELEELFQFNILKQLFKNNKFRKIYIKGYEKNMGGKIKNKEDMIKEITTNPKTNLENILKYLVETSLSTLGCIIIEKNNKLEILVSTDKEYEFKNKYIVNKCKLEQKEVILENKIFKEEKLIELQDIEIAMSMPIPLNNLSVNTNAYIYIESDKFLHNLNDKFVEECRSLFSFLQFLIETYLNQLDSNYDKLTMAFTRKYLEQCLNSSIIKCEKNKEPLSIIMFDIDDFKNVNDRHGHKTGDLVLREVCKNVLSKLKDNEFLGRYGGEEFIIILENTDVNEAYLRSEEIRKGISSNLEFKNSIRVTVSLGVASYPKHSTRLWNLIEKADAALYKAKETGKDNTVKWSSSFSKDAKQNDKISWVLKDDYTKDYSYLSTLFECIDIINSKMHSDVRTNMFLDKVLTLFDGESISLFILHKDKNIKERFYRKSNKSSLVSNYFNEQLLGKVISNKNGMVLVDWNDIKDIDPITNIPNCYSVIINPLVKSGQLQGVLYLKVPVKTKEFSVKEFNFTKVLCKLIVNI